MRACVTITEKCSNIYTGQTIGVHAVGRHTGHAAILSATTEYVSCVNYSMGNRWSEQKSEKCV